MLEQMRGVRGKVQAHLKMSGRVQGVAYRFAMGEVALQYGVAGWVRNLPTGEVEAVCEGDKASVEAIIAWCHQGPPAARVRAVDVEWLPYQGEFKDFRVI